MTVLALASSQRFHGSGGVGPFTWTWRFLANADIRVYRVDNPHAEEVSLEVRTLLSSGDYLLTGAGSYTGGSVTLAEVLPDGQDLIVERHTELVQNISIRNQGNNFRPEVHEDFFDRLVMMLQERARDLVGLQEEFAGFKSRVEASEASRGLSATDGSGRYFTIKVVSDGNNDNGEEILFPKIIPL